MAVVDQHTHHQKFGRRASFKFRALLESYESSFTHAYTVTIVSRAACRPSHLSGHACWRARSVSVQTEARGRAHTWLSAAPTHARTLSQPHHSPLSLPPVFPRVGSLVHWWPLMPPHSWGGCAPPVNLSVCERARSRPFMAPRWDGGGVWFT